MNDPVKRITIPEIRKEPWFQINCPPYLAIPWKEYDLKYNTAHINMPEFIELLMQGPFLGKNRSTVLSAITSPQMSPIKVTFELKMDQALKAERQNQIRNAELDTQEEIVTSGRARVQELTDGNSKSKRWFLGVQSRKDAAVIMIEVCKTISWLNYQWYLENEYRICCRQTTTVEHKEHVTEMRLQLYKVQEHAYLLDFQKLNGNVCSFMHMCGTVIDQLQKRLSHSAHLVCKNVPTN